MSDRNLKMIWEHEFCGEFSDYKVVEELADNGNVVRISFHMERPPRGYHTEIWSWSGAPRAFDVPGEENSEARASEGEQG